MSQDRGGLAFVSQGDYLFGREVAGAWQKLELKLLKGELQTGLVRRRRQTAWRGDLHMLNKKASFL